MELDSKSFGVAVMKDFCVRAGAGASFAVLLAVTVSASALAAGAVPDLAGTYWITRYEAKLQLVGGGEPPLNEMGRAAYAMNQKGLKDGSVKDMARKNCMPDGIPRVLANPFPFEVIQAPAGFVTIAYELSHQIRFISIDKPLPSEKEMAPYPWYDGHSAGHFEGDTLVVDSAGFNQKTFLDATGLPHDSKMQTTERIRKIAGNQLEDVVTITDPTYYTKPFSARFVYNQRNDVRIQDYFCGDKGNRDISSVPGVRRP